MILDLECLVKLMKGSWMSNGRRTLTKWMLVRRYEVHDAPYAGLREKGLLVEVDDPGVVLQDVLVLLQAVLQGSRLHKRHWRVSATFAVRSSSKAASGITKILWILAPEITFGQRKVVFNPSKILSMNDDDGLRIDLALRMLFCFGVLPIRKPHSRLSCHDKLSNQSSHLVKGTRLCFVRWVNHRLDYSLVFVQINRLVSDNLKFWILESSEKVLCTFPVLTWMTKFSSLTLSKVSMFCRTVFFTEFDQISGKVVMVQSLSYEIKKIKSCT